MSNPKSSLAQRYEVVMLAKRGESLWGLHVRYSISVDTIKHLVTRYDKYGIDGLKPKNISYYSEQTKISALNDYELNGLSLLAICEKYDISRGTFKRWLKLYEAYKKGDKFALCGGKAVHKCDVPGNSSYDNTIKPKMMPESKEKQERRKAFSKLSKKELQELLLDREAELDILKNLEALARERENKRHAILRKLSKD